MSGFGGVVLGGLTGGDVLKLRRHVGELTSPNYEITYVDSTLFITYGICTLYDPEKAVPSGSTIPIKLQLCDVGTAKVSAPDIVVNATSVIQVTTQVPAVLSDSGNANPDLNFRYAAGTTGAYIFNLST